MAKPFRLLPDSAEMLFPGLSKCGVLVILKASALNCSLYLSAKVKVRDKLVFRVKNPGPRIAPRSAVPNVAVFTAAKAVGSK